MKIYSKIGKHIAIGTFFIASFGSCNYLDVVPVEQADTKDMMIDNATTLNNLYACYGYLQNGGQDLADYWSIDGGGTDETVRPQEWQTFSSRAQWNAITPSSINTDKTYPWNIWYNAIGYCNQFLKLIEENNPTLNPNDKEQYIAEVKFLKAYYHFRLLQMYGPIPVIDQFISSNISKDEIPGRSHFDYCVEYIVKLFDDASYVLPPEHTNSSYYGRATSVICKALKARVRLLAASPLWNGEFPYRTWKNEYFETPGYGKELVSFQYDRNKWVKAREACIDAINAAKAIQTELFDIDKSEILRQNQNVALPAIPGAVDEDFRKKVMMLRYMMTTKPDDGNKEIIWGIVNAHTELFENNMIAGSLPHYILQNDLGVNVGGWGGLSPTLYCVEHFYTNKGKLPAEDLNFTEQSLWFKSAGLANQNIINLNVGREPRFYAWLSFDGDEYSSVLANRQPLICEMRNPNKTGYDAAIWGTRNYSVTGFLNKKWIHPNLSYTGSSWNQNFGDTRYPTTLIRLGELYLNLAECDAHLGGEFTDEGVEYLDKIRKRAGIDEWKSEASMAAVGKTILDAVMEERFVELYMEGHRYYDIRRYVQGKKYLKKDAYRGLNAMISAPTFEVFNTPITIGQPFDWNDRMYLMPISNDEIYSNPQLVQAPGY